MDRKSSLKAQCVATRAPALGRVVALLMLLSLLILLLPKAAAAAQPAPASFDEPSQIADAPEPFAPEAFVEAPTDPAADLEAELGRAVPGSAVHVEELGWGLLIQGEVPSAEAESRVREIAAKVPSPVRLDLLVRPPMVRLRVRLLEVPKGAVGASEADKADAPAGLEALSRARVRGEEAEGVRSGGVIRIHLDGQGGVVAVRPIYEGAGRIRLEIAKGAERVRDAEAPETRRSIEMTPWSTLMLRHVASDGRPRPLGRIAGFLRRPWTLGRARPAAKETILLVQPSLPAFDEGASQAPPAPDLIVADLAPPRVDRRTLAAAAPLKRVVSIGLGPAVAALRRLHPASVGGPDAPRLQTNIGI